ncbi:MAG: permease prefix domain 1-containing protein [Pyrinomonadaceae bacterium]
MNNYLDLLLNRLDRSACEREVEAELQFHIERQAEDYERQGLTPEESLAKAALRFGDFADVKMRCVQIRMQNSAGRWAMKTLFTIAFLLGVLLRIFASVSTVTRVGDVLIMIAVFGGLLLYAKRIGTTDFRTERKCIRLGLNDGSESLPLSFDEEGRTPFDRVRADDQ